MIFRPPRAGIPQAKPSSTPHSDTWVLVRLPASQGLTPVSDGSWNPTDFRRCILIPNSQNPEILWVARVYAGAVGTLHDWHHQQKNYRWASNIRYPRNFRPSECDWSFFSFLCKLLGRRLPVNLHHHTHTHVLERLKPTHLYTQTHTFRDMNLQGSTLAGVSI
jgi:hypothetical protein